MHGLTDLHCHLLPGVDDGPGDLEAAVTLVQSLEDLGFEDFYPTPHQKAASFAPTPEELALATGALTVALSEVGSPARIHPAAGENMWDELFLARQPGGFPTYPGSRAFLLEFALGGVPPGIRERLFAFRVAGLLPVVAHVERYPELTRDLKRLEALGRGAALLTNLTALGGMAGWSERRLARKLVTRRLVHAVATDSHGAEDVPALRAGLRWLAGALGEEGIALLLRRHPQQILAGELPEW